MRKEFSKAWKGSKKPSKQRKYGYNAPLHIKGNFLNAHLSEDLMKKYSIRSLRVRKGDKVTVMRGQFRKKSGKVERVDVKKTEVYVSNVELAKKDGSKAFYPVHPSNLLITELNLDDKKRMKRVKK
jgi:large subunit ribosomal protein L24